MWNCPFSGSRPHGDRHARIPGPPAENRQQHHDQHRTRGAGRAERIFGQLPTVGATNSVCTTCRGARTGELRRPLRSPMDDQLRSSDFMRTDGRSTKDRCSGGALPAAQIDNPAVHNGRSVRDPCGSWYAIVGSMCAGSTLTRSPIAGSGAPSGGEKTMCSSEQYQTEEPSSIEDCRGPCQGPSGRSRRRPSRFGSPRSPWR